MGSSDCRSLCSSASCSYRRMSPRGAELKLESTFARPLFDKFFELELSSAYIPVVGSRARKIRSIAPLAFVPKDDKNSDALDQPAISRSRSWASACIRGPVALPRYWIPPARPAGAGGLLIRHLSSSGAFRGSYDASLWPTVGIVRVLRRNSVSAPLGHPLAEAQPPSPFLPSKLPHLAPSPRAYSRFANPPVLVRESRARESLEARDCSPDCAPAHS